MLKCILVLLISFPLGESEPVGIDASEYDKAIGCAVQKYGDGHSVTTEGVHTLYSELGAASLHHLSLKHIGTTQDFLRRYSVPMPREDVFVFLNYMFSGLSVKRVRAFLRRLVRDWC